MKLTHSLELGPHAALARMVGKWQGMSKLWLEPGKLHEETPITGTMVLVQDGMFLLHEYKGTCMSKPQTGTALCGFSCAEDKWNVAWIDSFHNGTRIMFSEGAVFADESYIVVGGQYPAPPGPHWGWRTTMEMVNVDHIFIYHYNVSPEGEEAMAVEIDYHRS